MTPDLNPYVPPGLIFIPRYGNYRHPDDPGESGYKGNPQRRSVTDEETTILADLARGKAVLEIGTGLGVSTRALASTAIRVFTVDPDLWVVDPELPGVDFSRELPAPDAMRFFDLAFIDGLHTTEAVVRDIEACRAIPELVLHDTYLAEVMAAIHQCNLVERRVYNTVCRLAVYGFVP